MRNVGYDSFTMKNLVMYGPPWREIDEVVGGKHYRTKTADLLAFDADIDYDRKSTQKRFTLFKTPKGNYFLVTEKFKCLDLRDEARVKPLSKNKALESFWRFSDKVVPLEEAFPGVEIEDA